MLSPATPEPSALPARLAAIDQKYWKVFKPWILTGDYPPEFLREFIRYRDEWDAAVRDMHLPTGTAPTFRLRPDRIEYGDGETDHAIAYFNYEANGAITWDKMLKARGTHDRSPTNLFSCIAAIRGGKPKTSQDRNASTDKRPATAGDRQFNIADRYFMGSGNKKARRPSQHHGLSWEEPTKAYPFGRAWPNSIRNRDPEKFFKVFNGLNWRQQRTFRLYFEENWLMREIARDLRRSEVAVCEMMGRIRQAFKEAGLPDPKHLRDGRKASSTISMWQNERLRIH